MADPSGSGFLGLEKVVDWLWAIVAAIFAWGWQHTHRRIDIMRKDITALNELKVSIARVEEQIDRLVSDVESEKRTRSDTNRIIFEKLDRALGLKK